ncbi:MAG TPA: carboxypeptidase-like regulatory domain-containing protein [Candidatus Acidoferrales bacterium]|nr:carboxypeptidase-like regulatory domain-containing protein [Candidatus Acidoferrales bacterium]
MNLRAIRIAGLGLLVCACALPLASSAYAGKISGLVVDPTGTPQMGATVLLSSEQLLPAKPIQLLTNDRGRFSASMIPDGLYSIQVTLAGFIPAIEQHVLISQQEATRIEIVLGTLFSSFEKLRRQPDQPGAADDWTWVVRSAAADRTVLRWQEDPATLGGTRGESGQGQTGRGLIELTSGADHPGSISDPTDSPATAFVYSFGLGASSRLLMAGQYNYQDESGGLAAAWLPTGEAGTGPVTTILVRESRLGPNGPVFRGLRMSHDSQLALGDRLSVRYGGEYVVAGFNGTTSAMRPRGEVAMQLSPDWQVAVALVSEPWQSAAISGDALESTLNTLNAFPTLLVRGGHPVLENGFHEELAVRHTLSKHADVAAAVFHDSSTHTAVIGRGGASGDDFLQDYFSQAFAYDGGATSSTGVRVAYRQNLTSTLKATLVYAYAGALAPTSEVVGNGSLRDILATQHRQSLAGGVSATLPHVGTKFTASYKWIGGSAVSQLDPYGESIYQMDPYLSMGIRQPLPYHMEVVADMGNLLAQGYVPISTSDGRVFLVPSYRYFKGGLSLQF